MRFKMLIFLMVGMGCTVESEPLSVPGFAINRLSVPEFTPERWVEISFQVAAETDRFQVVLSGLGTAQITVERIEDPGGHILLGDEGEADINPVPTMDRAAVIQVPSLPGVQVREGLWRVWVSTNEPVAADAVLIETGAIPDDQVGSIELSIRDVGGVLEGEEGHRLWIEAALASAYEIFVESGAPSIEVVDWSLLSDGSEGQWDEMEQVGSHLGKEDTLFGVEPQLGRAISVYLVQEVQRTAGKGSVIAWSGGSPGPAMNPGGERAGILWAPDLSGDDTEGSGRELAHAIGHYLGLKHTTEANGEFLMEGLDGETGADDLEGTSQCPDSSDLNNDFFLTWSECHERDGNNLMFWKPVSQSKELVLEQILQMRLHPLVQ